MKFIIKGFLLGLFSLLVVACSADYLGNRANTLSSITIKANVENTTIGIDQTLEFTVEGDDGEDYTSQSVISVNGEPIEGNTFSFAESGEYEFTATYLEFNSNPLLFNVVTERFLTIDKSKALRNQTVQFKLLNPDGTDATDEAQFYVDDNLIEGTSYTTDIAGVYSVYAVYDNGISQTDESTFEVFIPKRKIVYEDYTGAWCGWCVRVTNAVRLLKEQSDDVVVVAIHNNDVMAFEGESQLANQFGVSGYPTAKINRTLTAPNPEDGASSIDLALTHAGEETDLSIAVNTTLNGDNLNVVVKLISENAIPATNKLVVYVYQNGLIFPQTNYYVNTPSSPYYQMGNPIPDFVHDDVLEASLTTNVLGESIPSTNAFEVYSRTFSAINLSQFAHTESPNTYDPTRFGVAVYVVDENNNALNAQHVKAGQSVNFE
ncbi:MAG: Omp28-related outer membrane protein [Flavobacteriaceae bacterium]